MQQSLSKQMDNAALPAQYETPIRVGGEVITTVSNVLFNEASSNEERSDNRE